MRAWVLEEVETCLELSYGFMFFQIFVLLFFEPEGIS